MKFHTILLASAWRPLGLLYMAMLILGLAAGFYQPTIFPPHDASQAAPLPALQTLAVSQVIFILVVYPLAIFRRMHAGQLREKFCPLAMFVESAMFVIVTVPLYAAAAYVANATMTDVLRTAIATSLLYPAAWVAGYWLTRPAARPAVLVLLLLAAIGAPAGYYIMREFLSVFDAQWLWQLGPATLAWQTAASRSAAIIPQPTWATFIWPAVALAGAGLAMLTQPKSPPK